MVAADMASVHLSISKHSQLSPLSTGEEVIPFFPFSPRLSPLSHFCPAFPPDSFISFPPLPLYFTHSFSSFLFFPGVSGVLFSLSLHSSLSTLNGTAHSATKQSCLQHHTLANQAGPEFSSCQTRSAKSGYGGSAGVEGLEERKPEEDKYSKSNDAC